jgi:ABC-type multidrug transport system fused ATPase/permease subunit
LETLRKVWQMLTAEQKRGAAVLFALMLGGMVLETLGVGLVVPALALVTQNDIGAKFPVLVPWLHRLGDPSRERLIVYGMVGLFALAAFKAAFLAFLTWRQMRFIYGAHAEMSHRLFASYLRQPYLFHLQRNSAQLIRNVVSETQNLTQTGMMAGLSFLTELFVVLGVAVLLLVAEPLGAVIVMSTLAAAGFLFNHLTKSRVRRWGEARQLHDGFRIQHLQQGLGGVKDVQLFGRVEGFLAQFARHNEGNARIVERWAFLQQLPRLWLELLAVGGLTALVLLMLGRGRPIEALLPTIALFAAAAFRLMPSVNRMLNAAHAIVFALPVVHLLYDEMPRGARQGASPAQPPLPLRREIALDRVTFRYPSTEAPVLREVSLTIAAGTSIGFIGGSGCGKSTLIDLILGLIAPEDGNVRVDGVDIQSRLRGWQDQIGYVAQAIFLTDDTLRRNVAFGIPDAQIDEAAVRRAITAAQLDAFVRELPAGLDTVVGERGVRLSGGQRQRIAMARALFHDPSVLVLDEATSSLDAVTEQEVMGAVRSLHGKKTILIVAHRLSTIETCDQVFRIEQGQLRAVAPVGAVVRAAS